MFENIINNKKNSFYPITEEMVLEAEKRMGIKFPLELRKFYLDVGCGFIEKQLCEINRMIGPLGCSDIRLREDIYEYDPDLEMYEKYEKNSIIFFEINEGLYASIGIEDGKIYYTNKVIADTLEEFLEKMAQDSDYWNCENNNNEKPKLEIKNYSYNVLTVGEKDLIMIDFEDEKCELLSIFLESDVLPFEDLIKEQFDKVLSGKSEYEKVKGNNCLTEIDPLTTQISFLWGESDEDDYSNCCNVDTRELKQLIDEWCDKVSEFRNNQEAE